MATSTMNRVSRAYKGESEDLAVAPDAVAPEAAAPEAAGKLPPEAEPVPESELAVHQASAWEKISVVELKVEVTPTRLHKVDTSPG